MRPRKPTRKSTLFPIGAVNQRVNRTGLEYSGVSVARSMRPATVPMPIRASLAQDVNAYRIHFSRKLRFLRTYGFAPGNPVLKAPKNPYTVYGVKSRRPLPVVRGGKRAGPLSVTRTPAAARPGYMGSPKRFPKALPVVPNNYTPPIYGE